MEVEEKVIVETKYNVKEELQGILDLFQIQSSSGKEGVMRHYIKTIVNKIPNTNLQEDLKGNLLITKGKVEEKEVYPCVIAHMDIPLFLQLYL
jgi:putative aminopeptidase FrvX